MRRGSRQDVTIAQLREQSYCGFYVAIGAQKSAAIRCPGETLTGVLGGVDFLRSVNLGEQPDAGKAVAVIGGGNGSIDIARAALRLGAEKVCLVYRRSKSELKADREEIEDALAEGMELKLLRAPAGMRGRRDPRCTFTEEQFKKEASRCLGCGVSIVDTNRCIGCSVCTTRCEFDAIHLRRDHPEATKMIRSEDKMKAILPYMVKRAARIKVKELRSKRS